MKVLKILSELRHLLVSTYLKFHQNLITSYSITVKQSLPERWQKKEREKKEGVRPVPSTRGYGNKHNLLNWSY